MSPFSTQLFLRVSAMLPLRINHWIGTIIGRLAVHFSEQQHIAQKNIERCFPKLSATQQKTLLRQTLIETAKTLTETGTLWFGSQNKVSRLIQEVHGEEWIQKGLEQGKGVILAIPHLGSWEAVNLYCSARYPTTSLYRPPRMEALSKMILKARQRFGSTLVPTNTKGVRALFQALSRNEMVLILPDQDPRDSGHFAPFFGIPASTMTLLSRLAQKTGAAVVAAYAERLSKGRGFAIHFQPTPETIREKDLDISIGTLNSIIEACIKQIPAQYQWGYKRFRTRPPGEPEFYSP